MLSFFFIYEHLKACLVLLKLVVSLSFIMCKNDFIAIYIITSTLLISTVINGCIHQDCCTDSLSLRMDNFQIICTESKLECDNALENKFM